jgi:CRISPR/Cas system endoribonuclease Cas6 (RAMP superfamily)
MWIAFRFDEGDFLLPSPRQMFKRRNKIINQTLESIILEFISLLMDITAASCLTPES